LAASYLFYAAWNPPFVLLLLFSIAVDWQLARAIGKASSWGRRRALLAASVATNIGVLAYFKYAQFLLGSFTAAAQAVGVRFVAPELDIVLPIGISFYTFQSLSYTIDVYRGAVQPSWSFRDFALFVSFFPQLVAGPIVRASYLLPQLEQRRMPTAPGLGLGTALLVMGLFMKVVMADSLLAPIVDLVYADPDRYGAADTWLAVASFSGQIYYDFAGYSLCAIGVALCFGFAFSENFRYPYAASGFSDFWRRWHVSLSTWLRDYLYIALGGNRGAKLATYRNLLVTMLIGGLWHGASWLFVLWGMLHGLYLMVERALRTPIASEQSAETSRRRSAGIMLTFLVVTLTWIPFRSGSLEQMAGILGGLLRWDQPLRADSLAALLAGTSIAATLHWQWSMRAHSLSQFYLELGLPAQVAVLTALLAALYLVSGGDSRAFIYFQF
jgi:D-alanyl-lipoteichoic acid acyltransferase DltB (MBOAT superfamily)